MDCFHGLHKFLHKILNCLNVTEYEKALGEGVPVTFETFHVWGIAVYKKITFFQWTAAFIKIKKEFSIAKLLHTSVFVVVVILSHYC